jgi:preprotein translocase subunit SecE
VAKKAAPKKKSQGIVRETIGELRKVSWPSRQEALSLTWVVILVMIVMAAFLGGLDYVFIQFFAWLFA